MSDIVKQQSKRFQRIFGNLPKQYGYCVTTENGISIVRDCKRWHFEIVGADKHVAKPHNRCVTVLYGIAPVLTGLQFYILFQTAKCILRLSNLLLHIITISIRQNVNAGTGIKRNCDTYRRHK